jgi:ferric-dicitrate binding protein FerR (iron transport regulator)
MNSKEINNRTDKAWEKLHARLESDGLIEESPKVVRFAFRPAMAAWAAGLALIITASLFLIRGMGNDSQMLILANNESSSSFMATLEDGSIVYLAGNTTLSHPEHFRKSKREVYLEGDAFFEVAKNSERPFVIETQKAVYEVLGTSFDIKGGKENQPSLTVRTGSVKMTLRESGESLIIKAGESAFVSNGKLGKVYTSDLDHFQSYMDRIHFKDERLSDLAGVINRNFGSLKLEIDPAISERRLTATFAKDTPDSLVELICSALGLRYSIMEGVVKIHE